MPVLGGKHNADPHSNLQDQRAIVRRQGAASLGMPASFGMGMMFDPPVTPSNALKYLENYTCFEDRLITRRGSKLAIEAALPALYARAAYTASKTGDVITKTVGASFVAEDATYGRYFVWDDGTSDKIIAFTSTTKVQVDNSTARTACTAGYVRGAINGRAFDDKTGLYILHIGDILYVLGTWDTTPAYTQAYALGPRKVPDAPSRISVYRQWAYVFTSNGIFRINIAQTPYVYFWLNSPIPTAVITDSGVSSVGVVDSTKPYGRRYLYTTAKLTGTGIRDRHTDGVVVEKETGPTMRSEAVGRDYGTVWTARPAGTGATTYGVLTGGELGASYAQPSQWRALGDDTRYSITGNGETFVCVAKMGDVYSMKEVAAAIQLSLRDWWAEASCEFEEYGTNGRLVITMLLEGGTITETSAGDGGTDIGTAAMSCQSGTGAVTTPVYAPPRTVGTLTYPKDTVDDSLDSAVSHYGVYCTLDIGANGYDPVTGDGNLTETFMWLHDIEVARAMYLSTNAYGIVTADAGQTWHQKEVGDSIMFNDGTTAAILYLCDVSGVQVYTGTSRYVRIASAAVRARQASCMGGGERMVCSQTGQYVAIVSGSKATFDSTDVGKAIYWSDGISWIIEYVNAVTVMVVDSTTRNVVAATMNPVSRSFSDNVNDNILRGRLDFWALRNRFWEPLPPCNIGAVASGMMFGLQTNGDQVFYSQMPEQYEYLVGFHHPGYQILRFDDSLQDLIPLRTVMVVPGIKGTGILPISTFLEKTVSEAGEKILIVQNQDIADPYIGIYTGNWTPIGDNGIIALTTEPELRTFDGVQYGPSISKDRFTKLLRKLKTAVALSYDQYNGLNVWGSEA